MHFNPKRSLVLISYVLLAMLMSLAMTVEAVIVDAVVQEDFESFSSDRALV